MDKEDGNMTRQKVTDPTLLSQLGESPRKKVTDPKLLAQLNDEEDTGAYLDNLPEGESFLSKLPKNILTGLTHTGRNLHNLPHDLSKLAEWPAEKIAGPLKHPLSSYLPYDEQDYSDVFGSNKETDTMLDKLIKGGVEHAPEIAGGVGLVRGGFRKLTGTHQLNAVERAANQSGLKFNYKPKTIKEAEKYFPPSHATKEMIADSNAGFYGSSFKAQSQVGHHQRNLVKSPLAAENLLAPRAAELKQTMLGELSSILKNAGMHNEVKLLSQGINNYRQYMKVRNAVMPVLKKLGIPTSLVAALGFGYSKTKKALSD